MKVDIIKKFKWYIVGFILVAIMLSVSLSFCAWDTLSAQAKIQSKSGGFELKWNDYIKDANGNTIELSKSPQVGDIVTFGNYYQNLSVDGNAADKTAIRWIVVHKEGNQFTLLAEKVIVFGSFWGTYYYNSSNGGTWGASDVKDHTYYQNYSQSTVRAWLNSNETLRNDAGTPFSSAVGTEPRFKGFLSEAFTADEQAYITDKTISGIRGAGKADKPIQEEYATVTDKVWLPSYIEMYGNVGIAWGVGSDNLSDTQFEHFKNGGNKIGSTTAYASTTTSNYTMDTAALAGTQNYQNSAVGNNVWWWLRSPYPTNGGTTLVVYSSGECSHNGTYSSYGGVRPAVCVQL